MKDYSGIMGTLYLFAEWFLKFTVINLAWFIINIPIALIILNISMSDTDRLYYAFPLIILVPLLFFPSTIALYATVRSWILKKSEGGKLLKEYFSYFKKSYLKSFYSGLLWGCIWFIWVVDLIYFNKTNPYMAFFIIIIGFILFVFNINFFSLSVHYHMKTIELLKNSFYVTIGSPLLFIAILFIHFTLIILGIAQLWFIFPLLIGTVSAFVSFLLFYWLSLKVGHKQAGK